MALKSINIHSVCVCVFMRRSALFRDTERIFAAHVDLLARLVPVNTNLSGPSESLALVFTEQSVWIHSFIFNHVRWERGGCALIKTAHCKQMLWVCVSLTDMNRVCVMRSIRFYNLQLTRVSFLFHLTRACVAVSAHKLRLLWAVDNVCVSFSEDLRQE